MKFKKIRGISVPYERQGLIFFTLATYNDQPPGVQKKIDRMIEEVCRGDGLYIAAMRDWLLHRAAWETVALRPGINEGTLLRYRRKIFEKW